MKASLKRLASRVVLLVTWIDERGEVLTLGIRKSDGQSLRLGCTFADVGSGVPHPAPVAANVGGELHVGNDYGMHQQPSGRREQPNTPYRSGWRRP